MPNLVACRKKGVYDYDTFTSMSGRLSTMCQLVVCRGQVGETGVGCHTGWLSHCQYLIRWMAVPCGDLHVTCAQQTEPYNVQTLAADRIFRLLQVHITFRVTFVIFVVIMAYDVAIILCKICKNSPVHRIKQKISYQSDSVQQSLTQMA